MPDRDANTPDEKRPDVEAVRKLLIDRAREGTKKRKEELNSPDKTEGTD